MRSSILELLRNAGGNYVSGEEIAVQLGVSRTAVWKHIQELRQAGYDIVSHSRSGYSLRQAPDLLLPGEIRNGLETTLIGQDIRYFEDVSSTNTVAKALAADGAVEGTIVVSEAQGAGRGRLSRGWFSPARKGIWFSLILRPDFLPQDAPKCTLLAAVAVVRAIRQFSLSVGIKWPNDILFEGRKLVGILTEMSAEMERVNYIVIGTGINVNMDTADFPPEVAEIATSLSIMKGEHLPRVKLLQAVLTAMEELYLDVLQNGFVSVLDEWRQYSVTLGQEVRVLGIHESFVGKAVDIDEDGALLVDTEHGRRRVLAGDVSIRPRL